MPSEERRQAESFLLQYVLSKLFQNSSSTNEQELPPELRAQRVLSNARIPDLKNYILNNPDEYIFSSLTASVDGKINFIPAPHLPQEER